VIASARMDRSRVRGSDAEQLRLRRLNLTSGDGTLDAT
jgi:hypothetical protein